MSKNKPATPARKKSAARKQAASRSNPPMESRTRQPAGEASRQGGTVTPAASPAEGASLGIDIGISAEDRQQIATELSRFLADAYTLYLKTHNFHWNVTGPMFNALHTMFETQYTEQWAALDDIAERIRALGYPAPGSFSQFTKLASIKEEQGVPNAQEMLRQLVEGHEAVARTARQVFPTAEQANDQPTADLLTQRLQIHEKTAWMLRSMLE